MELKVKPGSATTHIAIGAVCVVFLIAIIVANAALGRGGAVGGVVIGAAIGGSLALVIGVIRHKWAGNPVATIDANGITPHPLDCGTIPWSTVRSAEVRRLMFARQLVVETTHPMKRAPVTVSAGLGMAVANKQDHNRFTLGIGPMDHSPEQVQAEIAKYRSAA